MLSQIIPTTLVFATPLIFGAMAGYTSERSGVVNIGLEGIMLSAACTVAVLTEKLGVVPALIIALIVSTALSLLHWLATQKYQIDHVISGMVVNLLASGTTNYVATLYNPKASGVAGVPVIVYQVVALVLPFALWWHATRTRDGLRMVATGADPNKARLAGIVPEKIRFGALIATGILGGLGGTMLMSYTGGFTDNMTAGRGYIALAALIVGGWRPLPTLVACLAFGLLSALRAIFAGNSVLGLTLPSEFWSAMPYLATIIALAGFLGRPRTPAGLGKS